MPDPAASALGAAISLAIPETSKQDEVMGEAHDNVVEKGKGKSQKVQRVAEEAQGAARQEGENRGLEQQ